MTNESTFNEDFARWYRSLDFGSDPETYEKRRAGTYALAGQATPKEIEALVRVALKSRHSASSDELDRLRKPLRDADAHFPTQGNDRELQIIAAAVLSELLRRSNPTSHAAALALSTAFVAGMRRHDLPLDLAER